MESPPSLQKNPPQLEKKEPYDSFSNSDSAAVIVSMQLSSSSERNSSQSEKTSDSNSDAVIASMQLSSSSERKSSQSEKTSDSDSNAVMAGMESSQLEKTKPDDSDDGTDDENTLLPDKQFEELDEYGHLIFDPRAKKCLDHYNDKHDAKFIFEGLDAVGLSFWDRERYYTFRARSSLDGSVHTFQGKDDFRRNVKECKISDIPYLDAEAIGKGSHLCGTEDY